MCKLLHDMNEVSSKVRCLFKYEYEQALCTCLITPHTPFDTVPRVCAKLNHGVNALHAHHLNCSHKEPKRGGIGIGIKAAAMDGIVAEVLRNPTRQFTLSSPPL